jgi:uncharacterized membrane protein YdbT with pleckstrin-like domain
MTPHTFIIKSLWIQDTIMLFSLSVVVFFLLRGVILKKLKHVVFSAAWVLIVLWFFNSPFFGFSAVTVEPTGIRLDYGILSIRNTTLSLEAPWSIETSLSGLRKLKRLYFLRIGTRESMKVTGGRDQHLLQETGDAIDSMRKRVTGVSGPSMDSPHGAAALPTAKDERHRD